MTSLRLAAFASPAATIAALGLPIVIFLPPLYAELGLSLTLVGSVFMFSRVFDVVTDPLFGILGDRVNGRWGRRKPTLVVSVPILLLGSYWVFFPGDDPSAAWLLISMLVLYIGWTMYSLSHIAWASELSSDYDTRSRIMGVIHFFTLFGSIVVLLLPAVLDYLLASPTMSDRAAVMGLFIIVTLPLFTCAALFSTSEPVRPLTTSLRLREAVTALVQNVPLRRLLLADFLLGLQGGVNGAVHFFFISHVLLMPRQGTTYLVELFVVGLVCVPLFLRLSYRIGKHQTLSVAALITSIGTVGFFFLPPGSFWLTFVVYLFVGVSTGAKEFLMRSIMADVIDQDRLATGTDRSALYYSMLTLTAKIGLAASVGIVYPMLDLVGFDPSGENGANVLDGVRLVVAISPTLLLFLAAAIMYRFPLDRQAQETLRKRLEPSGAPGDGQLSKG